MKQIENKIKDSIQVNDLCFFDKLPQIEKKKNYRYVLSLAFVVFLFIIVICNKNTTKSLADQKIDDSITFNILNIDDESNKTMDNSTLSELMYSYGTKEAILEDINRCYNINMSNDNLESSSYTIYNDGKDTIIGAEFIYEIDNESINVKIADNLKTWNIQTGGFINALNNSTKSIVNDKQIILAKRDNNEYPEYIIYEHENSDNYYALYKKDNLYYYITSNIDEEKFLKFLKNIIL